jgi:hypothetical protein
MHDCKCKARAHIQYDDKLVLLINLKQNHIVAIDDQHIASPHDYEQHMRVCSARKTNKPERFAHQLLCLLDYCYIFNITTYHIVSSHGTFDCSHKQLGICRYALNWTLV